jgi:protease secretion system outer membrane protein
MMLTHSALIFSMLMSSSICYSVTLTEAMDAAMSADTRILSAKEARDASNEEEVIGFASLLPSVNLGARATKSSSDSESTRPNFFGNSSTQNENIDSSGNSASLTIRQPLFDMQRWAYYQQGKARTQIGQEQFNAEQLELYSRVVEAYFNVLKLRHEITLAEAQKQAIETLAKQTRRLFDAGESTITDIEEAQARLDSVVAQLIELNAIATVNLRSLSNLIGQSPESLLITSATIPPVPLLSPEQDAQYWLSQAEKFSPLIATRVGAVELAKADLKRQKSGYYPTISIAGQLTKSSQDEGKSSQDSLNKTVALMLEVPLYEGGSTNANTRKSTALLTKSQIELDGARQKIAEDVERNYLGVSSGWAKCNALISAVRSNEKALSSAEKGFQAGTRSTMDILDAQQRVFSARRDLLNTKLIMLLSFVKLKVTAGQMDRDELQNVERLLK